MAVCQNLVPLVNIKIAGKWMFISLNMVLIGIDPYPNLNISYHFLSWRSSRHTASGKILWVTKQGWKQTIGRCSISSKEWNYVKLTHASKHNPHKVSKSHILWISVWASGKPIVQECSRLLGSSIRWPSQALVRMKIHQLKRKTSTNINKHISALCAIFTCCIRPFYLL